MFHYNPSFLFKLFFDMTQAVYVTKRKRRNSVDSICVSLLQISERGAVMFPNFLEKE